MASELDKYILGTGGRQKANGDIENFAPSTISRIAASAPPIGASADPRAYGQPGSKAFQQTSQYSLGDRRLDLTENQNEFNQEHTRALEDLAHLKSADEHVTKAYNTVKQQLDLQDRINQKLDTTDFLRKFSAVRHDDPDYEEKVGVLAALHPLAGNDDMVKSMLTTKHEARGIYTDVMKTGGVNQFDGPARDAYMAIAKQTGGDVVAAHAAAKRVAGQHDQLLKDKTEGFITDDDLWDTENDRPKDGAYNSDGSLNYDNLRNVAATKSGARSGKIAKAEDSDDRRDLMLIEKLADKDDDTSIELRTRATARMLARDKASSSPSNPAASSTGARSTKSYTTGF